MENLDLIAERIAERLEAVGLTERKASILATGQPDAIRYIRTRGTMPSAARMMKIAKILEATPDYIFGDSSTNDWESNKQAISVAARFTDQAVNEHGLPGRRVPINGVKSVADDANPDLVAYALIADIVGFAAKPAGSSEKFGSFYPADSSMAPVFDPSTPVVFSLEREAELGDHALLFLRDPEGRLKRNQTFILRKLVDRASDWVTVQQHTPSRMMRLPAKMVDHTRRVLILRDYVIPSQPGDRGT